MADRKLLGNLSALVRNFPSDFRLFCLVDIADCPLFISVYNKGCHVDAQKDEIGCWEGVIVLLLLILNALLHTFHELSFIECFFNKSVISLLRRCVHCHH